MAFIENIKLIKCILNTLKVSFLLSSLVLFATTLFPDPLTLLDQESIEISENYEKEVEEETEGSKSETEKDDYVHKYFHSGIWIPKKGNSIGEYIYIFNSQPVTYPTPPPEQA